MEFSVADKVIDTQKSKSPAPAAAASQASASPTTTTSKANPAVNTPSESPTILMRLNAATMFMPGGMVNALYGPQIRRSFGDFIINSTETIATVVTGFDTQKGDKAADWLKGVWDKYVAAPVDGQFDFKMAKGWKMPEGMRYNGLLPSDPKYKGPKVGEEIQPFWSIFHRDRDGNVNVLDKDSPMFAHIVGPYVAAQVGLVATVGTKGVTSMKTVLSATSGLTSKAGMATYLTLASADLWGAGGQIVHSVKHSMFLKPEAIERFAHIIDKPGQFTPAQMMKDLNIILEDYANKSGRKIAQFNIDPLTSTAGVMELADQMSKGQVKGYVRAHGFAEIAPNAKKEDIHIGNIREVAKDPYFQRSFFQLAAKAIDGHTFNASERMALRFGMNIMFAQKDLPLAAADNKADLELHTQALKALRGYVSEPLITAKFRKYFEEDKSLTPEQVDSRLDYAMTQWVSAGRKNLAPDKDLKSLLDDSLKHVSATIHAKEQEEIQRIQLRAQTMAMMP